jgi:hypothetical protein
MSDFVEAMLLLLPPEAGGRRSAVEPRAGSYLPFARVGERLVRVRVIEGPPRLAPGDAARVVLESDTEGELWPGAELPLVETGAEPVGVVTVLRVWRNLIAV